MERDARDAVYVLFCPEIRLQISAWCHFVPRLMFFVFSLVGKGTLPTSQRQTGQDTPRVNMEDMETGLFALLSETSISTIYIGNKPWPSKPSGGRSFDHKVQTSAARRWIGMNVWNVGYSHLRTGVYPGTTKRTDTVGLRLCIRNIKWSDCGRLVSCFLLFFFSFAHQKVGLVISRSLKSSFGINGCAGFPIVVVASTTNYCLFFPLFF